MLQEKSALEVLDEHRRQQIAALQGKVVEILDDAPSATGGSSKTIHGINVEVHMFVMSWA